MGRKGGDTRVKRQLAPSFWNIKRKESQFVLRVRPGPHPKDKSYPLGMILRDLLKLADTMHEAEKIVNAGKVKVDGIAKYDINHAVGLMDVVELVPTNQAYRLVPRDSEILSLIPISENEKSQKLVKVTSKVSVKNKRLQYGFHDGRTLVTDQLMNVGDTCLIATPKTAITNLVKFERGCLALITSGENAGGIGKVEDIKDGIFSLPRRAIISTAGKTVELPVEMTLAIGHDTPLIKVNE